MLQFLGLTDLSGVSATGFSIGLLDATLDPVKGTWPTTGNPIDWWFLASSTSVAQALPTNLFTSTALVGGNLTAGATNVNLTIGFGGAAAVFDMLSAQLAASIDATPAPDAPAPPPEPHARAPTRICGAGNPVGPNCNSAARRSGRWLRGGVGLGVTLISPTQPDVPGGSVSPGSITLTPGTNNKVTRVSLRR